VPDLSHLWQRFLLAIALLFGLVLGVGATVFGYSNTAPVAIGFSVFHIDGVPLWTVALVPLALVLVTGTVFHWLNGLHHFTEHMRHRRRVHELEAEVTSLRAHMDKLLEMPDHTATKLPPETVPVEPVAALPEPAVASNGDERSAKKPRKRISLSPSYEAAPVSPSGPSGHLPINGEELPPREESSPET
jgi:hypothetical protein